MKKQTKQFVPAAWQVDPENVQTDKVQLWSAEGGMITAQMSKEHARELVSTHTCFVITSQAICYFPTH